MNHLIKRQPSSCAVVLLNCNKQGSTKYCPCNSCLRGQPLLHSSVRKSITHITGLKLKLDKVKTSKKEDNAIHNDLKKISQNLKPFTSAFKTTTECPVPSGAYKRKRWKNGYSVDSTQSFDPNLLSKSLQIEQFYEKFRKKKTFRVQSIESVTKNLKKKALMLEQPKVYDGSLAKNFINARSARRIFDESPKTEKLHVLQTKKPEKLSSHILKSSVNVQREYSEEHIVSLDPQDDLVQFLHSSIDICITNDMTKEAYELLCWNRKKLQSVENKKKLTHVYNTLLFAFSKKGYWHVLKTITNWMETDGVRMNADTFAAMLQCLEKIREVGNEKLVQEERDKILNFLFVNGVTVNDIFTKTKLTKDTTEKVLNLVREAIPSFEIKSDPIELSSNCVLLKNLNETDSNLEPPIDSPLSNTMENLIDEQILLEKNFFLEVKAICNTELSEKNRERVEVLKQSWKKSLTAAIQRIQEQKRTESLQPELFMYLNSLPTEKFVDILMKTTLLMLSYSGNYGPAAGFIRMMISSKVSECYQFRKKEILGFNERTEAVFKKYVPWYVNPHGLAKNSRQQWQMLIQDSDKASNLECDKIEWPHQIQKKLGKFLLDIIFNEVKFTVSLKSGRKTLPVFYTVLRNRNNEFFEEIKCHPFMSIFDSSKFETLYFRADEIPMLCPPKPWSSVNQGGYLTLSTELIRKPGGCRGKQLSLSELPNQELYASFDSLNVLQGVPWMINSDVLDVALKVFRSGGSAELKVPLTPVKQSNFNKSLLNLNYEDRKTEVQKRKEIIRREANNYSLWCEALYRLSLANYFRKRMFWLPQNCDFRGRVYPVPPLLNHTASDLYRSLLVFAKGKPLGPKGLDWLKIHVINLTGTHKRKSVEERLKYANEVLPKILDSAEKPLTGDRWWIKSDEPWQTLAACMELKKALSLPNPEDYICRFPIHQDGSCNGLQHYAALGRDVIGANSVNLISRDTPQDVYNLVADLIEEERIKDAKEGYDIANLLEGFVGRKIIKQTVMTSVYGVTAFGARSQIERRLEEAPNFPQEYVPMAASYLTNKTFLCLEKMFTSAKKIQDWFVVCAREICAKKDYVHWISPMGLPVVQPYAKHMGGRSRFKIIPDVRKQVNAFPPNFIHSLDSSHMMLTALYCEQAGVTFGAVHDCFWTHPNSVDVMNRICREQFISLHSKLLLLELSNFFVKNYQRNNGSDKTLEVFRAVPQRGDFELKEILKSVYFFS